MGSRGTGVQEVTTRFKAPASQVEAVFIHFRAQGAVASTRTA